MGKIGGKKHILVTRRYSVCPESSGLDPEELLLFEVPQAIW